MNTQAATTDERGARSALREAIENLEIALPAPGDELEQDEEWVLVKVDGEWKKIRLHDYSDVYAIPGLYEKWIYEIFQCKSPDVIRELLDNAIRNEGADPSTIVTLDLGAGNGIVAEVLEDIGFKRFVGVDIAPSSGPSAERDRPGLYEDYIVGDLLNLSKEQEATLAQYDFGCLTCVAALGFGDIPPAVFANAYNRVHNDGWVAFTIKTDFLNPNDQSGFSVLIRRMMDEGALDLIERKTYRHRISTDGQELLYDAFLGRKRADIKPEWIPES